MKLVNNEQYNELKFMVREWHNARIYNTDYYLKLLLQYRRENNIYEVGDVACYKNHVNSSNTLFKFFQDNEYSDIIHLLRHATPQEIEVGRRL